MLDEQWAKHTERALKHLSPEPTRVFTTGSHRYGLAMDDSDVDLVVVVSRTFPLDIILGPSHTPDQYAVWRARLAEAFHPAAAHVVLARVALLCLRLGRQAVDIQFCVVDDVGEFRPMRYLNPTRPIVGLADFLQGRRAVDCILFATRMQLALVATIIHLGASTDIKIQGMEDQFWKAARGVKERAKAEWLYGTRWGQPGGIGYLLLSLAYLQAITHDAITGNNGVGRLLTADATMQWIRSIDWAVGQSIHVMGHHEIHRLSKESPLGEGHIGYPHMCFGGGHDTSNNILYGIHRPASPSTAAPTPVHTYLVALIHNIAGSDDAWEEWKGIVIHDTVRSLPPIMMDLYALRVEVVPHIFYGPERMVVLLFTGVHSYLDLELLGIAEGWLRQATCDRARSFGAGHEIFRERMARAPGLYLMTQADLPAWVRSELANRILPAPGPSPIPIGNG